LSLRVIKMSGKKRKRKLKDARKRVKGKKEVRTGLENNGGEVLPFITEILVNTAPVFLEVDSIHPTVKRAAIGTSWWWR
jgi:hypothetical protein